MWTGNPQVGLRGESNQQFNNRETTNNWTATSSGTVNTAWCELSSTVFPPSGFVFKFVYNEAVSFDAGVHEIVAPIGPFIQGGERDIEVSIINYGIEELTSVSIGWQVGESSIEYFLWSGDPLQSGETSDPVNIGNFDFQSPGGIINAWTEMPNGQPDPNPGNDSAYRYVFVNPYCLEPMDCEWVALDDFTLAELDHQNSGCSYDMGTWAYGDFTLDPSLTTQLYRGSFYTWTAQTLAYANLGLWIDFNNDYEFDHTECIYVSEMPFETSQPEDNFILSDTVPNGTFRMRVRITISQEPQLTAWDACTDYWEGEIHDYTISVIDLSAPPDCATSPSPENGATGIQLNPVLACDAIGATSYDVYFGTSSPPRFVLNKSYPIYLPGILMPNTKYYWQLVPRNSYGAASDCEIWEFTTGESIEYCSDLYSDGCYEWGDEIEDFILNDIQHLNSECTGWGYGYFPEFQTELDWSGNYTWYADVPSWEYLGMWIDYNIDGDFDDTGEFVYGNPEPTAFNSGINAWGDFTLPEELQLGDYRLRIRLVWSESLEADESCEKFIYGETQDYTITVVAPTTAPDCVENPIPANGATDIPINDVILYWEGNGASSYDVYFGINMLEFVGSQDSASFDPEFLMPNTTYQWKIVPKNIIGGPDDCEVWTFTTNSDVVYCEDGLYSSQEFYNCEFGDEIDDFALANINHVGSGCSWAGYGDFTENQSLQTELQRGLEYEWTASIGLSFQDWMAIWIDFDKDGEFDDGYECVFQSDDFIPSAMSSIITIPEDAPLGTTRLRARIKAQYPQLQCNESCEYFPWGEIHDYTVHISDPAALPECSYNPEPGNGSSNVPIYDVVFSWAEISNAVSYDVYFGTSTLEFIGNQIENNYSPGELEELTNYQWKIVPVNSNGSAEECEVWEFATGLYENISGRVTSSDIKIYPNPSEDGSFTIVPVEDFNDLSSLRVIDSHGRFVVDQKGPNMISGSFTVQVPDAQQGIYYLLFIFQSGKIITEKLIILN